MEEVAKDVSGVCTCHKVLRKGSGEPGHCVDNMLGFDAMGVYESILFTTESQCNDIQKSLEYLDVHVVGKRNVVYDNWLFNTYNQQDKEDVQHYLLELCQLTDKDIADMTQSCQMRFLWNMMRRHKKKALIHLLLQKNKKTDAAGVH